ncbi:LOW QUALITY PROTEIN: hypothetical protein SETIT_2G116500v2 [Setaria italica]|uniref:AP2/ERF domain-containing protein n=1 Tax=Setaria italica TaxID=4555 RepID=A0A368PYH6_SETIT|nr:LOW QUALITY PROTEIN: hypothetical protein SETIT_2G116500v2 [Setaria italica]
MILQKGAQTLLQLAIEAPAACACATCGADGCAIGGCELLTAAETRLSSDSDDGGEKSASASASRTTVAGGMGKLRRQRRGRVSKYRGAAVAMGQWAVEILDPHCAMRKWLGTFDTTVDAARAYDFVVVMFRGRRAKLNFPDNATPAPAPSWVPISTYLRHHHLPQPLPESLHETCGSNVSSPVRVVPAAVVPAGQHGARPVLKEQDIWDRLNEIMMMDDGSFWSSMP